MRRPLSNIRPFGPFVGNDYGAQSQSVLPTDGEGNVKAAIDANRRAIGYEKNEKLKPEIECTLGMNIKNTTDI